MCPNQGPLEDVLHGRDDLLEGDLEVSTGLIEPSDGQRGEEIAGTDEVCVQMWKFDQNSGRV